ncbi:MAG: 16S rRNA (uracil(1498)-N(3))-methyltransferase [Flavobacteriaceae bacterium]|nr:16S rRNA (uracil(1498)-N(3))-methyltransferase [Flavobacteriaceae bacterium]
MEAIFYIPNLDLTATECFLPAEEAKHAIRVLRMQEGDTLLLTDGIGHFVKSHIATIAAKKCVVAFDEITKQKELPYSLHLAVAPTKNNSRYEWLLEKITEMGISKITPLISSHSERKTVNLERLEKIIISAVKQSQKAYMPQICEPISFVDFMQQSFQGKKYIAHCNEEFTRISINENYQKGEEVCILIGPEGDFSPEEIAQAEALGFQGIHLGTSRLRTETAGLVACSTIYQLNY